MFSDAFLIGGFFLSDNANRRLQRAVLITDLSFTAGFLHCSGSCGGCSLFDIFVQTSVMKRWCEVSFGCL